MSVICARCSKVLRSSFTMNATRFLDFALNDKRKLRVSSRAAKTARDLSSAPLPHKRAGANSALRSSWIAKADSRALIRDWEVPRRLRGSGGQEKIIASG